eukprot:PhM_4_TR3552/c0_g1_i1/m.98927/K01858/INO1, ISYNA1; myo-inositol-1-phosphate synthase
MSRVQVNSSNVTYGDKIIQSVTSYTTNKIEKGDNDVIKVTPVTHKMTFETQTTLPKLGLMLVGWGGNNGSTVTAGILANKHNITWHTRRGENKPNYFGSITQSSTLCLGSVGTEEVYAPMNAFVPMVHPNDIVLGGWDLSCHNLADAMSRAAVLDYDLQRQMRPFMEHLKPLPALYDEDFIAPNQKGRATNIMPVGMSKEQQVERLRGDIRDFKSRNNLDKVIVLWTATTERFMVVADNVHGTADSLKRAVAQDHTEIAPSVLYAIAAVEEGCSFINGSPQNTCVPGLVELAARHDVFLAGDDFKSGQTKFKSVLVEFLVGAGIKPECIASYNHLGNNDGYNLSNPPQFRSKEITKSNVVDDMVSSNKVLYAEGERPDHCIVIKYLPYVGDSKRALDEYTCSIFMGGEQTFVVHNTCEDSLLAAPLILDLTILTELMERVTVRVDGVEGGAPQRLHTVASLLSYLCKAPAVPPGTPVVNAQSRQKQCIDNFVRALVGLSPENNLLLEHKIKLV